MIIDDIRNAGTSIWLDDLSRAKITGTDAHSLPARISQSGVVGVTTNPSIFSSAISGAQEYAADIAAMKGSTVDEVVRKLTTDDVRNACDLFSDIYTTSKGVDGRVSIEVDPRLAHNTKETIEQGRTLYALINRPNVMIKVPATIEGLPAITALISEGISVNVTLIFSLSRYEQVIDAFMQGLEARIAQGESTSEIHSVASFFISRIDSAVDQELKKIDTDKSRELLGKTAIANAALAYEVFEKKMNSTRWKAISQSGANMQRPLWASTGVKDPAYEDTRYVIELIAPHTVNTMPQSTLDAVIDHGVFRGNTISETYSTSREVIASLDSLGISLPAITNALEIDGVKKFAQAWEELLSSVAGALNT
ncbi:unannotated protein [freshwater metagenome]|uniref:Unannotated protein n=1 Tax=freshwater metagenome TaxID=449393 RepID=A0A6J7XRU4_9ZZZZ|nr:transaldolase [Actinomycetota bacterium]